MPVAYMISHGLSAFTAKGMTLKVQKALMKIIARIAETSYRRGFQHGVHAITSGRPHVDPYSFRYMQNLDKAKGAMLDRPCNMTAFDRLSVEHNWLFSYEWHPDIITARFTNNANLD